MSPADETPDMLVVGPGNVVRVGKVPTPPISQPPTKRPISRRERVHLNRCVKLLAAADDDSLVGELAYLCRFKPHVKARLVRVLE